MPSESKATDGTPAGSPAPSSARPTTLYDTLGIALSATTEEITIAYRKLALACHPDRPDGSTEKFQELQRAYEVLNNPTNRAQYDSLLKGKPILRNFKRPAKLEKVEKPVYALLADLAFYQFEGAPSKLRCSVHYGDGIEFNNERGSFIGLAGDGFLYWSVNGRGYATQLCKGDSDMALSNVRVVYRSNMGLRRKPLERSHAGNSSFSGQPPQDQRTGTRSSVGSPQSGRSGNYSGGAGGGAAPRLSEAERLRQQIRNKERHRSATKRLETIEREEADERNDLERYCWEKFCTLHTNLEAGMRCVTLGLPVASEMALFMGYASQQEVPLAGSPPGSSIPATEGESPRVAALWVDPLEANIDDGDEGEGGADAAHDDASDGAAAEASGGAGRQPTTPGRKGHSSPSVSPGGSASSAPTRSDSSSDTASDGDSCRARPTAGPQALKRTGFTAAYVSPQPSGSSPMLPGALLRPAVSASSSLGNARQSPMQPAPLHAMPWASSPGAQALPTAAVGTHGLAAEARPLKAPQVLHTGGGGGGSSTTVQFASGTQRPASAIAGAATAASRDHDGLVRVTSGPDSSTRASRASVTEADHPSLPNSLSTPPTSGLHHEAGDAAANRFVSLLHAAGESDTSSAAAFASGHDSTVAPTRPLYPWSATEPTSHNVTRDVQARATTTTAGAADSSSPAITGLSTTAAAPPHTNPRGDTGSPVGRGTVGGELSNSPSPQPARERTSVFSTSQPHATTASPAAATAAAGSASTPVMSPPGQAEKGEEPPVTRTRPSLSPAAAGHTHEGRSSLSPRPTAVSQSPEARKTPRAEAISGRSVAAQSCSRGESGDGCTSYGAPSGATVNHSQEEGRGIGFAASAATGTAAAAEPSTTAQETPRRRHLDVGDGGATENSALRSQSGRASHPITALSGDFRFTADTSFTRERGDATLASGGAVSSSGTTATSTNPRVTIAPLRLSTSQDYGLARSGQDGELDAPLLSPNAAAAEKRRRSKGRVTPRYMLATQAHARRVSGIPLDGTGGGTPAPSPRLEAIHAYNSMSAAEMLAEEEEFMNSFAKTKRVT